MKVTVDAVCRPIKGGIQAQALKIGLTGHGESEERALESLCSAVRAWCSGLTNANMLEAVLDRRGMCWSDGDAIGTEVSLNVGS